MATQVVLLATTIAAALCLAAAAATAAPAKPTAVDLFKNYALSACLSDGYKSDEVVKDSAAAARGYLEHGSFPLEAHTEATQLGRAFLSRVYQSQSDQPLVLMKCLDLFHSKELSDLAAKYRKRR
jgi:hypothetical protein